ncbi:MAG: hypothetical protein M1831_005756 [Alyxoria varia]|nr:MAG: hypothetical protein M1831_005756 [Alyxoria varia]
MPSMPSIATAAAAVTLTLLFQSCPAPPAAAIGIAGGAASGAATAVTEKAFGGSRRVKNRKRQADDDGLAGLNLPTQAVNDCRGQLAGAHVSMTPVGSGARFDGVPSACMTLANVFLGQNTEGQAVPVPMGSASLLYDNLKQEELRLLQDALASTEGQQ